MNVSQEEIAKHTEEGRSHKLKMGLVLALVVVAIVVSANVARDRHPVENADVGTAMRLSQPATASGGANSLPVAGVAGKGDVRVSQDGVVLRGVWYYGEHCLVYMEDTQFIGYIVMPSAGLRQYFVAGAGSSFNTYNWFTAVSMYGVWYGPYQSSVSASNILSNQLWNPMLGYMAQAPETATCDTGFTSTASGGIMFAGGWYWNAHGEDMKYCIHAHQDPFGGVVVEVSPHLRGVYAAGAGYWQGAFGNFRLVDPNGAFTDVRADMSPTGTLMWFTSGLFSADNSMWVKMTQPCVTTFE